MIRRRSFTEKCCLDPRTKLLLILTMTTVLFSGSSNGIMGVIAMLLTLVPFLLFLMYGRYEAALRYAVLYLAAFAAEQLLLPHISGTAAFLVVAFCGIFSRMMPGFAMGYFLVNTTKVSEFTSAMEKMHVTPKISIPLSVIFRFFPTLGEEYNAIGNAMKMRGIRFGGKHPTKMIEYRLIPLLMSSVKIGEELSAASLTRGLGAPVKRTNICKIGFGVFDFGVILLCIASLVIFGLSSFDLIGGLT